MICFLRQGAVPGIHNAGGIGGLLAVEAPQAVGDPLRHWYFYDGNGNVGQLLAYDATGPTVNAAPAAHYEYDPYGQLVQTAGSYADANPFRFSTKWFDTTTGLGYWGYRHYSPRLGRWMSRDPIEELGGPNLCQAMANSATMSIDPHGEFWTAAACCLCVGSLVADFGGGAAGCLWGCYEVADDVSTCFFDCIMMYLEDRGDHSDPYNVYKTAIEAGSCVACGIRVLDPPPPPISSPPPSSPPPASPPSPCAPCPAKPSRIDRVPPSKTHHPCPGDHRHRWVNTGQGPPPECKCSYREEVDCL